MDAGRLTDSEYIRFSRQILLPDVGEAGQLRFATSHVAIIGVGGLGQLAAQYLAAAGVGHLTLIDPDRIEVSNLPRQLLFDDTDIGEYKALITEQKLKRTMPSCQISASTCSFTCANAALQLSDLLQAKQRGQRVLVLDCTDNFATRQAINRFSVEAGLPLVSAAIAASRGQLFALDQTQNPSGGCYHCIFPANTSVSQSCSQQGVLGPSVGVMASMQSQLALRYLLSSDPSTQRDEDSSLSGYFWRFDANKLTWHCAKLTRDPQCSVCGNLAIREQKETYDDFNSY